MNVSRRLFVGVCGVALLFILSGCMYPNERRPQYQIPPETLVNEVQKAIDLYYEKEKVLPIFNSELSTPIYEKYIIDFRKMVPDYLSGPPANVFELGGSYYYVLIDVETNPTVKLLDLRVSSKVGEVQNKVNQYKRAKGSLPIKEVLQDKYYSIDYDLLKIDPQQAPSVYSHDFLPLVMDATGTVGVDYRIELMRRVQEAKGEVPEGRDIRYLLTEQSLNVPIKSFPMVMKDGEIMYMAK